jgi:hypothetical protein
VAVSRKSIFDSALALVAEPTVIVLTISKLAEATSAFLAASGRLFFEIGVLRCGTCADERFTDSFAGETASYEAGMQTIVGWSAVVPGFRRWRLFTPAFVIIVLPGFRPLVERPVHLR